MKLVAGLGIVIVVLASALGFTTWRWTECHESKAALRGEYTQFVEAVKKRGEDQEKETAAKIKADQKWEQENNAKTAKTIATLRAERDKLRNGRKDTGGSILPPVKAGSSSPETACFDRSEFERAVGESLRRFRSVVDGIIDQGDEARVNLDGAKEWSQKP